MCTTVDKQALEPLLDQAAADFSDAVMGEGREGGAAFMQKRLPAWADVPVVAPFATDPSKEITS